MASKDLRYWIALLEREKEIKRIKAEVDWREELGGIVRKVLSAKGPALLFENIKDYNDGRAYGSKLISASYGTYERIALSLGLPKNAPLKDMIIHTKEKFKKRLEPAIVRTGPIKQNIVKADDIDLFKIPVPRWHDWDGGRYINTSCSVISKDPETGDVNVGTYRGMLHDKRTIAVLFLASQHWGIHGKKAQRRGEKLPVAVVIGYHPLLRFCAGAPLPAGVNELDVVGALQDEPVELVKCETVDLYVPASAEYVLEGEVCLNPEDFAPEGPFGEYTGYYGGGVSLKPTLKVNCLCFRNDPIFEGSLEGFRPGWTNETGTLSSISASALAWNILESAGVPGVTDVWVNNLSFGAQIWVQIHKTFRGQAKQVASALWASNAAQWMFKNVMVVEEDIDIRNYEELDWAFNWRVNAGADDIITQVSHGSCLDPSTRLEERDIMRYGSGKWWRMLIDATRNWDYQSWEQWNYGVYPPIQVLTKELDEKTADRWKEYGLEDVVYNPTMAIDKDERLKELYSLQYRPTGIKS